MSKPPFVISQTKWLPYDGSKLPYGTYAVKIIGGSIRIDRVTFDDSNSWYWEESYTNEITHYAKLPEVSFSEEFNFATALELMKEGLSCQSLETDESFTIKDDTLYVSDGLGGWCEFISLTFGEITGKWRMADV